MLEKVTWECSQSEHTAAAPHPHATITSPWAPCNALSDEVGYVSLWVEGSLPKTNQHLRVDRQKKPRPLSSADGTCDIFACPERQSTEIAFCKIMCILVAMAIHREKVINRTAGAVKSS